MTSAASKQVMLWCLPTHVLSECLSP